MRNPLVFYVRRTTADAARLKKNGRGSGRFQGFGAFPDELTFRISPYGEISEKMKVMYHLPSLSTLFYHVIAFTLIFLAGNRHVSLFHDLYCVHPLVESN